MKDNRWIVNVEAALIVLLIFLGDLENVFDNIILLVTFIFGCGILLAAFLNIGIKSYSPMPEPNEKGDISQRGLYKYVRHPMYMGFFILGLVMALSNVRFESFFILLVLIYVLNMKADIEEEMLAKKHPKYLEYQNKTKKFIPYIL